MKILDSFNGAEPQVRNRPPDLRSFKGYFLKTGVAFSKISHRVQGLYVHTNSLPLTLR